MYVIKKLNQVKLFDKNIINKLIKTSCQYR